MGRQKASQVQSSMHTYVHSSAMCNLLGGSQLQQNRQFTARFHRCSRRPAGKTSSALAATLQLKDVPVVMPEEYWLPPGELSTINRNSQVQNQDIFRCFGCTRSECEVRVWASWTAWHLSAGKTTAKPRASCRAQLDVKRHLGRERQEDTCARSSTPECMMSP